MLVLDEPTNDLDLETLELLEQQLVEWPGTLLLVSHDRRFLDNVVTSTLAFEGDGKVEEYRRRVRRLPSADESGLRCLRQPQDRLGPSQPKDRTKPLAKKKRTFKEEREYEELPARIAALEEEQKQLQAVARRSGVLQEGRRGDSRRRSIGSNKLIASCTMR